MNKTQIEWVKNPDGSQGYTWNPITGCLNHDNGLCKGGGFPCYAYKLANGRLKQRYLANKNLCPYGGKGTFTQNLAEYAWPFHPRFWEERLYDFGGWRENPKGIFVCDMGELFGDWIPEEWQERIFSRINLCPQHRFYLLTKQPQNLIKFSPFPENCWVGVTATNRRMFCEALVDLKEIKAPVKYISIEPCLGERIISNDGWIFAGAKDVPIDDTFMMRLAGINWLIIGACTGRSPELLKLQQRYPSLTLMPYGHQWTAQPHIEWVREIVEAADKAGIPVFLKDNLSPLLLPEDCSKPNYLMEDIFWASEKAQLRQEIP